MRLSSLIGRFGRTSPRQLCYLTAALLASAAACSSSSGTGPTGTASSGGRSSGGAAGAGAGSAGVTVGGALNALGGGGSIGSGGSSGSSAGMSGGSAAGGSGGTGAVIVRPTSGWRNVVVGGGGFISGIAFHPAEAGLAYLRTDVGGAYRFDTKSASWLPITDSIGRAQSDSLGILSLALDPSNPDLIYLMTGKYTQSWAGTGAVLISKDRGNSWTRSELSIKVGGNEDGRGTGERLQVDPNLGSHLLMGSTQDGLWESLDTGVTWKKVSAFTPTNVNFVFFDAASGTKGSVTPRVFVGTADTTQSLWLGTNGAFQAVAGQPTGVTALRVALTGTSLYLTYANSVGPNNATTGSVSRLDTSTLAWSVASPPTGSYGFGGVSIDAKNSDHLLVSTLDRWTPHDELYQSTDGGKTFSPLLDGAKWDRSLAPYTASSTPHWLADAKLDPFDPDHALFVTGYGLWSCTGLSAPPVTCAFQDTGIEETVAIQVIAPPTGAPLLSAMGDVDGFKHDSLDVSPPSGRYHPLQGTTLAIAFAEAAPTKMVKAHNASPFGSYSSDGGVTWQAFATFPAGATAGGSQSIAISADAASIVWTPVGATTSRSVDQGKTWQATTGLPMQLSPVADRVNAKKFYAVDALNGRVFVSSDGGATFTAGASGLPMLPDYSLGDANLGAVFGQEGQLWLALGSKGLFRSKDSGATFTQVTAATEAFSVGFGKAKTGASYPALYAWATVSGSTGIFRSDDEGATFTEVSDAQHKFGWIHCVAGDQNVYGRVFIATEGRGVQFYSP